jgi:glycosyltransferase involved in cell wall biosynthesis
MEKVLIATYYWPPSGGPGVQRWLKFARYLLQFGYKPVILTVDPEFATYPIRDESLLNQVPAEIEVNTTRTSEPYALYRKLMGKKQVPYSGFTNDENPGMGGAIARFIRGNFFLPDARVGWNKFAFKKALELIDRHDIKTVITTSPPHSTQILGLNIKRHRPSVKWIVDLRDPWTDIFYYKKMLHLPFIKRKDARLEKKVLMNADGIITVSKHLANIFKSKVSVDACPPINVITNGFDPDDFGKDSITNPQDDILTIGYTGTLSDEYDLSGFLSALSGISGKIQKTVKLNFTGSIISYWRERLSKLDNKIEISFSEHVSHDEAIRQMHRSDLLLLIIPSIAGNKGIVTGKIFEYIASGRPVLGIGPVDGDAADILSVTQRGRMFDYHDVGGIKDFICSNLSRYQNIEKNLVYQYSRPALTEKLVNFISG